ncbi:hypothetical protein Dimus_021278 [Dionaea muscipula]
MASKGKGKEISGKGSAGKRKRQDDGDDKTGRGRKNRDVLQFFEDVASEFDDDEDSYDNSDFLDDILNEYEAEPKEMNEMGTSQPLPFQPKVEELSGEELEKFLEERYRSGSGYVRYAEDAFESKGAGEGILVLPSLQDPPMWKVKCKAGREKHTVFCLMQKYVDLKLIGTKLQILSAFAVEHIKGFVFVEAAKQSDVSEACRQLADVYYSLVTVVPKGEVSHLLAVRKKPSEVTAGMWARVKNGIYKGDLAQVVAVNGLRKRATVQLIPRIDLQSMAAKFGGAASAASTASTKKTAIPAPRLISSSELEEFRPLIQYRRDRDIGKFVEVLDGLMLKDGFLFKKVSIESLSFWDVNPSEVELQKFSLSTNDDKSNNLEWLSKLYGEQKKKRSIKNDKVGVKGGGKGGEKGEGSSGSNLQDDFEVHDLVVFGKKGFGMITGMEKDEYKILIEGSEGPTVVTHSAKALKIVESDTKFTALDRRMKTITLNDTVRVLDGAAKGRQGSVKQVYRGIVFLCDQNELENPYFCAKSYMLEKVKRINDVCQGKGGEDVGPSDFGDSPSSPKSPLSAEKPWQTRENNLNQRDKEGFSIGQTLRIRIGPLKGYLCRVLAIRFSDITVKLASQQKVLTVKSEHLAELRGKGFGTSSGDDPGSSSIKPFDLLGAEGSNDWIQGSSGTTEIGGWNSGVLSTERSGWAAFSSSSSSLQLDTDTANRSGPADAEDSAWKTKVGADANSAWGKAVEGKSAPDSWGKKSNDGGSGSWGNAKPSDEDHSGSCKDGVSSWGRGKLETAGACDRSAVDTSWASNRDVNNDQDDWKNLINPCGKEKKVTGSETKSWGNDAMETTQSGLVDKGQDGNSAGCWDNKESNFKNQSSAGTSGSSGWGQKKSSETGKDVAHESSAWGRSMDSQSGWGGDVAASDGWGKATTTSDNQSGRWGNSKNTEEAGGWKKTGDSTLWGQSKNVEGDEGSNGGRGSGGRRGRGSYHGGRDQSGGGRGGAFGRGQISSWNKGQDGTSENTFGGNSDQGGGWGKDKSWKIEGGVGGGDGGWKRQNKTAEDNVSPGEGWGAGRDTQGANKWSGAPGTAENSAWNGEKAACERSLKPAGWNGGSSGPIGGSQQESWDKGKGDADESSSWGKSSAAKGSEGNADGAWTKARPSYEKQTSNLPEDSWGRAANKWGNMDSSSGSQGWKSQTAAPQSQSGGLGGSAENSSQPDENAAGGWNKGSSTGAGQRGNWGAGDGSHNTMDSWSKPKAFGADGVQSWGKSAGSEEDTQGFSGGRGAGGRRGRGSYRGGHDQFGRGRGRSFGRGDFSSGNKEREDGSSWGSSFVGNNDQGSSWGSDRPGKHGGSWGNKSGGNNDWGKDKGFGDDNDQGGGWSKHKGSDNQGWREEEGWKKQKTSFGGSESSGKEGWGAFPTRENQTSGVHGSSESNKWSGGGHSSESAGGNGEWKSSTGGTDSQVGGWGKGAGKWGQAQEENAADGWNKGKDAGGGWGSRPQKDGDSAQAQTQNWSRPSWNTSSGNGTWSQSTGGDSDQGFNGGRGSGGRRGRGSFRGGRDGRDGRGGGGRSFGRGQHSSWNSESQDEGHSADWRSDRGGSWGKEKGWNSEGGSDFGGDKAKSLNTGGGSSWGGSSGGSHGQSSGGGWGKGGSSDQGGGGWSKGGSSDQGGGGWGKGGSSDQGGGGWGKGGSSDQGGGGWGKGGSSDQGGGGGWGKKGSSDQGGGDWGKGGSSDRGGGWGKGGSSDQGGGGWSKGGSSGQGGGGGWSKGERNAGGNTGGGSDQGLNNGGSGSRGNSSEGGNIEAKGNVDQGGVWGGNSSAVKVEQEGGWGKAKGWGDNSGGGNASSGGNGEEGGGGGWGRGRGRSQGANSDQAAGGGGSWA